MTKSSVNLVNAGKYQNQTGLSQVNKSQSQVMGTQVRFSQVSHGSQLPQVQQLHSPTVQDRQMHHQSHVPLEFVNTQIQSTLPQRVAMSQVRNLDQEGGSQVIISQGTGVSSNAVQIQRRSMDSEAMV